MRLAPELKSKIDALWDKFWSGGLSNPPQSIENLSISKCDFDIIPVFSNEGGWGKANRVFGG